MNRRGHAGRTDSNQQRIVAALRKLGASVVSTSQVGQGLPDLLVGWMGVTVLIEIKDGDKPPSARKLTADEQYFLDHWKGGPAVVVQDEHEAVNAVLAHAQGVRR
jgi:Holliday junction resolvase